MRSRRGAAPGRGRAREGGVARREWPDSGSAEIKPRDVLPGARERPTITKTSRVCGARPIRPLPRSIRVPCGVASAPLASAPPATTR
jgi:hypothetical protein